MVMGCFSTYANTRQAAGIWQATGWAKKWHKVFFICQ